MRLDSVHHHKYQKSNAGSVTVLTAVPSRQSFCGANSFLVVSRLTHGGKPLGGLIPSLRFASPTGLVPVACITDYQENTTPTTWRLHGARPRGYHD